MEIRETARLGMDADAAWRLIGDFGSVGDWHPLLADVESEGNAPGAIRRATGGDGSKLVERLEAFDPDLHAYRYAIVESNLPIKDYTAEFRIDEAGADESLVVWTARFDSLGADADESAALVDQFLRAGVEALAEAFE